MHTMLAVTFAWSFAFAFWWIWRLNRCKHDWEPVVERELPSKAEELKKAGENIATWRHTDTLAEIASKTFFAIISCKKCGAVKQYTIKT
jgi:hypothetical protein